MKLANWLRESFTVLLTLPVSICLILAAGPLLTVWFDSNLADGAFSPFVLQFSASSALTILSTVASASMAALTLAYSMSLVVFTLAAGNIGPRLLQRFTTDRVTQITAGVLGGAFLYSLHAQLYVQENFIPKLTIAGSGFLAIVSVTQLIYFVRHIAMSIFIDNEIAEITRKLEESIKAREKRPAHMNDELPDLEDFKHPICAPKTGYFGEFDAETLLDLAAKGEFEVRVAAYSGKFVSAEEEIAYTTKELDAETVEKIHDNLVIASSRTMDNPINFSIRLLIEIALRALSPGVNDTYTAIAVTEGLTKAFSILTPLDRHVDIARDEDDTVRIVNDISDISEIIGEAFHPLRQACRNNILMAHTLAESYRRLSLECSDGARKALKKHAKLLVEELEKGDHLPEDLDMIKNQLKDLV